MFLIQHAYKNSPECRSAIMYGISNDVDYKILTFDELSKYEINLNDINNYIPFGSVEFVENFAKINNITIPLWSSYPPDLCRSRWLNREINNGILKEIPDTFFVKPIKIKLFTGTIKSELSSDEKYTFANEIVWFSPPQDFTNEWRFYILRKKIIGIGQYDNDDIDVDGWQYSDMIMEMVNAWKTQPIAYCIDIGIIKDVGISLIEVNDAWATGMYKGISPNDYVNWVMTRWKSICLGNHISYQ